MASAGPGGAPAPALDSKGAVRLRFCKESNDLLYPREDRARKTLVFACRNCAYVEEAGDTAEDFCVYRNIVDHTAAEKTVIVADVRADATLLARYNALKIAAAPQGAGEYADAKAAFIAGVLRI